MVVGLDAAVVHDHDDGGCVVPVHVSVSVPVEERADDRRHQGLVVLGVFAEEIGLPFDQGGQQIGRAHV